MRHIYLNLKRFDVSAEVGGVNRLSSMKDWAKTIIGGIKDDLDRYDSNEVDFTIFWPEAHIINATKLKHNAKIGCQGVYRGDIVKGSNFGAFTTNMPATAARELGAQTVIIGHCEERRDKEELIALGGGDVLKVNEILGLEVKAAIASDMTVLYCIGEKENQLDRWQEILSEQIDIGLLGVDKSKVVLAYEPVWAIGPGKIPPDREYIQMIAGYINDRYPELSLVYGGGLKADNAAMLASIKGIDGGLIALTRFAGEFGFYPDEYVEIIKRYMGY